MKWIALALLIVAVWIIYTRRKNTVTLTKEQAELTLGLISKERDEIEKKRQKNIDDGAAEGQTVPIENIFSKVENESDELVKLEIEKQKQELLNKYGPNIPVDVVYRLMKEWDPDEDSPWSNAPGCFERHLQRREGNLLFLPERRVITKKDIDEAQEKDRAEQKQFTEKVDSFVDRIKDIEENITPDQATSLLREVQDVLEEATTIGGDLGNYVQVLEGTEETIMQLLNNVVPDGADLLKQAQSLSIMKRSPYMGHIARKDSPILKDEQIPALLSEDLETISLEGYKSKAFAPDYKPNEADIRQYIENAVNQGFSKERADQIIDAWIEGSDRYKE